MLTPDFTVAQLAAFHGHLGPYIVLGYRMGRFVRERFCPDPFQMRAEVHCNGQPPQSCLADGVQLGSGCTLGKGNIEIVPSQELKCIFIAGGRRLVVRPRPFPLPPRDRYYEKSIEDIAERMFHMAESELFDAEEMV